LKTILITGGNSFLSKEFKQYFGKSYNLIITDRNTLDVANKNDVNNFFINNKINYVFHTAITGGKRLKEDTFSNFIDNLNMYYNLSINSNKFDLMFNFASGAEFDRDDHITSCKEEEIFTKIPKDFYGYSKNIISRDIATKNNIVNIRLFGCFGANENESRFIKTCIKKSLKNEEIIVQNKKMDFFSSMDLCILIEDFIKNGIKYRDMNAVYNNKTSLYNIAYFIKKEMRSESSIAIIGDAKEYTGCSEKLDSLNLNLTGLENSIKDMIGKMREI